MMFYVSYNAISEYETLSCIIENQFLFLCHIRYEFCNIRNVIFNKIALPIPRALTRELFFFVVVIFKLQK